MDGYGGQAPWNMPGQPPRATPPLPGREVFRVFNRVGWGLFLYILTSWAVVLLCVALAAQFRPALLDTAWFFTAADFIGQYFVALPVTMLLWSTIPTRIVPPAGARRRVTPAGFCLLVPACFTGTIALNALTVSLAEFIARLKGSEVLNPLDSLLQEGDPWLGFVILVFAAPLAEELLCRKLLYQKLSCFGGRVYILTSALLFSAMHTNLYQMLYAFVLGVVFASITYYTGSIKVPVALHMLVNLLGGALTTLLEHVASQAVVEAWSRFLVFLLLYGMAVIVLRGLYACREWLPYEPSRLQSKAAVILNPGMILYALTTIALTVYSLML